MISITSYWCAGVTDLCQLTARWPPETATGQGTAASPQTCLGTPHHQAQPQLRAGQRAGLFQQPFTAWPGMPHWPKRLRAGQFQPALTAWLGTQRAGQLLVALTAWLPQTTSQSPCTQQPQQTTFQGPRTQQPQQILRQLLQLTFSWQLRQQSTGRKPCRGQKQVRVMLAPAHGRDMAQTTCLMCDVRETKHCLSAVARETGLAWLSQMGFWPGNTKIFFSTTALFAKELSLPQMVLTSSCRCNWNAFDWLGIALSLQQKCANVWCAYTNYLLYTHCLSAT